MITIGLILFLVFSAVITGVQSWRLDKLGLDENVAISRMVVYFQRAFVTIPRVQVHQAVTLAELPWPEQLPYTAYNTKPFPSLSSQTPRDCSKLQSAVTLDMDNRGRLYVLDKGLLDLCPPKIILYDVTINQELMQMELDGVPSENLTSLVVDVNPENAAVRVILGDAGNNSLLVSNLNQHIWWPLKVSSKQQHLDDNNFIWSNDEAKQLSFNRLTIAKPSTLYATSSNFAEVYSLGLEELRRMEEPLPMFCNNYDYNGTEVLVKYEGNQFGPSTATFVDFFGNFYHMYQRDFAVLKWNSMRPFVTENTDVVLQDDDQLTDVVQIFSAPFYQIWALNSRKNSRNLYSVKLKTLRLL